MPIYLRMPGITGDATGQHAQWIEASALSSALAFKPVPGRFGNEALIGARADVADLHLTRGVDSASVPLARWAAVGRPFDVVQIHVTAAQAGAERTVFEYELSSVLIVGHTTSITTGSDGPPAMQESLSLRFARVKWTFKRVGGDITAFYDQWMVLGG